MKAKVVSFSTDPSLEELLSSRRPINTGWDEIYLRGLEKIGRKYNYIMNSDPNNRAPMPIEMMMELGFTQAALGDLNKRRRDLV